MIGDLVEVFFSYSHKDEALRDELAKHLKILERQGVISSWHDRRIIPGEEWNRQVNEHLDTADIILLLISSDFIASDYCWDIEIARAMERHTSGEACVIPVILREVDLTGASFARLQALPKNAQPVTTWATLDAAFKNITQGIRASAQVLIERRQKLSRNNQVPTSDVESRDHKSTETLHIMKIDFETQKNLAEIKIERFKEDIAPIEQQIKAGITPDLRKALDWLSNREVLVKKATDYVQKNCSDLRATVINTSDDITQDFRWEIDKYLELVYFSLLIKSHDLLHEPVISPCLSTCEAYEMAFEFIKRRIPVSLASEAVEEIKLCLDYLLTRIFA